jgi:hypothetical protein
LANPTKGRVVASAEQSFETTFAEIYSEAFALLVRKQERYGDSNIQQLGIHGVISRIAYDKIERAKRFLNGKVADGEVILDPLPDGGDESLVDTMLDIANYALITVALQRGKWGRPLDGRPAELHRFEQEVKAQRTDAPNLSLANLRVNVMGAKKK